MERVSEIGVEAARAAQERGELVLIDVREDPEWAAGRAPGSVHVPLTGLDERWRELHELDTRLAFLCRVGQRSELATVLATRRGLDAVNVSGGMYAWRAAGLPIEPGGGYVA